MRWVQVKRWLPRWRDLGALALAILVGLLAVVVITSIRDRDRALATADRAITTADHAVASEQALRTQAARRDDKLNAQIIGLQKEVAALRRQVRALGGQPVSVTVNNTSRPASQPSPKATSSSAPRPTSTRSPTPKSTPTPQRCVIGICPLGGNSLENRQSTRVGR